MSHFGDELHIQLTDWRKKTSLPN